MSVVINGSAGVTTNSGAVYNGIQAGTAVASTSGTSIDFTGIPAWVKRVTVMLNGVSTNGSSVLQVQLGGGGAFASAGYYGNVFNWTGGSQGLNLSSGFPLMTSASGGVALTLSGALTLTNISGTTWIASGTTAPLASNGNACACAGNVNIGVTLDRIRITTVNGTDTFDAGSINILYE